MEHMQKDFEEIYNTVAGTMSINGGVPWVEDAFAEGTVCSQAYKDFWTAREHLCDRFGLDWEDEDLELFMNGIMCLEKEIARRMFFYGIEYNKRNFNL